MNSKIEICDNAYWLLLWTMVAAAFLTFVTIIVFHNNKTDELIAKSADPIATACALSGNSVTNCMVVSARKN